MSTDEDMPAGTDEDMPAGTDEDMPAGTAGDRPAAVVAVVIRDSRVLVIQRGRQVPRAGFWAPLSGRVEPGEGQSAAVVRETREEVGLAVTPVAKVWECDTDDGHYRLHWWAAYAGPGELRLDPVEVSDARWIDPDTFGELSPTFADDRVFFAQVFPDLGLIKRAGPD